MAELIRPERGSSSKPRLRKTAIDELNLEDAPKRRLPRARTPEAREAQLAALAYDLAEEQFLKGTASSQVTVHFLKVGSTLQKQELQKLKQETLLVEAKVKDLANVEELKKLYTDAMNAMRGYAGQDIGGDDDSDVY